VHWAFLKNDYKKVVSYAASNKNTLKNLDKKTVMNEHAWTSYRIGESYAALGNNTTAVSYFENSTELAPFVTDFRNKLAGAQFDAGMIAEAKNNYEFILRENPKYSSAYISLGFLFLSAEKDVQSAIKMYDRALSLDPDNVQAFLNKAGAMLFLGREKEAKMYLKEVLKRDKSNEQAKRILSQLS
jgi:tetratricopeptide (TPR) repeat protein